MEWSFTGISEDGCFSGVIRVRGDDGARGIRFWGLEIRVVTFWGLSGLIS